MRKWVKDIKKNNRIFRFCTCNKNVIKEALYQIDSILKDEKDRGYTIKALDDFVKEVV